MTKVKDMVSVMLVNPQGQVLFQQRDHNPGIAFPGHWTIFGGAVEAGETPDEAVRRELMEELELDLPLRHWHSYTCPVRSVRGELDVRVHVYVGYTDRPVESLTLHEGMAMGYFDRAGASRLMFGFGKAPIIQKFFDDRERGIV